MRLLLRAARTVCSSLAVVLLLSACGGETQSSVPPFDAVLLELFETTDTEEYLADTERLAAEFVVTCMEEAGFEFQIPPPEAELEPPDPRSIEDARAVGFGIIAGFRFQLEQTDLEAQLRPDPNMTYLGTLELEEIERFFVALDGVEAEPGQRQEGGCNGFASDEAYADWLRFFEALPNFTALGEERDTHPDWLAARADWRDCMQAKGFDYSEPDAIRTDVISRMRESVDAVYPGGQLPMVEQDGAIMVDPVVDELLDDLVDFEIEAAVANVECTAPLAEQFDAVERLVQQDFVDRNRSTIDDLLDAAKQ